MAIYFISTDNNYVKIGYSKNPKKRILDLQTASPRLITVHGIIKGDMNKEREIHKIFADFHYRGEWFLLTTDILAYINGQPKWKDSIIKRVINRNKSPKVELNKNGGWIEWQKSSRKNPKRYPRYREWVWDYENNKWAKTNPIYRPELGAKTEDEYNKFKKSEMRRKEIGRA